MKAVRRISDEELAARKAFTREKRAARKARKKRAARKARKSAPPVKPPTKEEEDLAYLGKRRDRVMERAGRATNDGIVLAGKISKLADLEEPGKKPHPRYKNKLREWEELTAAIAERTDLEARLEEAKASQATLLSQVDALDKQAREIKKGRR